MDIRLFSQVCDFEYHIIHSEDALQTHTATFNSEIEEESFHFKGHNT